MRDLEVQRLDMKCPTGPMPHEQLMDGTRDFGEKVIPLVQEMLAE